MVIKITVYKNVFIQIKFTVYTEVFSFYDSQMMQLGRIFELLNLGWENHRRKTNKKKWVQKFTVFIYIACKLFVNKGQGSVKELRLLNYLLISSTLFALDKYFRLKLATLRPFTRLNMYHIPLYNIISFFFLSFIAYNLNYLVNMSYKQNYILLEFYKFYKLYNLI